MRKCKKCGAESDGKFCHECGAPIEEEAFKVKESEAVSTTELTAPLGEVIDQPQKAPNRQSNKTLIVLAGSKNPGSYLNKGVSTILFIFGTLAMLAGVVLSVTSGIIFSTGASSKEYLVHHWYDGYMAYTLYSVTPEKFNKVILLMSLASFFISAGLAIWAVRKTIVYPELATLLNNKEDDWIYNIYYEGLNADQKKLVDAQCQVSKTYQTIRLLTYIGSAVIACGSVIYWINAIGFLVKYYNQFNKFADELIKSVDFNNPNAYIMVSFCFGLIIAFYVVLIVYEIVFVIMRRKLNAKAREQLENVKL